jgi:hypothetical protein
VTNKFVSVLDKIGAIGKDIFKEIPVLAKDAEPVLKEIGAIAQDAEPEIAIAFPSISPLYNLAVVLINNLEISASAAGAVNADKQKKAMAMASLLPFATANAQAMGIVSPTPAQVSAYIDLVVAEQKLFQALD